MKKRSGILTTLGLVCILAAAGSAQADQTAYTNALMQLNPVACWPLQETNQTLPYPTLVTNYGTMGAAYDEQIQCGSGGIGAGAGPLGGAGDLAAVFNGTPRQAGTWASGLALPATSSLTGNTGNVVDYSPAPPFTIEFWIDSYDPAGSVYSTQCPISDFSGSRAGWLLYTGAIAPNQYDFRTYPGGTTAASLNVTFGSMSAGEWNHVAIVFDAATNVTGYFDGVKAFGPTYPSGGGFTTNDGSSGSGLAMGIREDNYGPWPGALAEVAYYTNALDSDTVASHYAARTNAATYVAQVLAQNPIFYFQMDAVSPTPVAANIGSLGAAANGYYDSGLQPGVAGPAFIGLPSNTLACSFNGLSGLQTASSTGPTVELAPANPPLFDFSNVTAVAWVQISNIQSSTQEVLGRSDGCYRLWMDSLGNPHFGDAGNSLIANTNVADGLWHMWTGTYDKSSSTAALYIDGSQVATGSFGTVASGICRELLIGGAPDHDDDQMIGNLAYVALFTNALTATQVGALYNAANPPATKPPPQLVHPVFPVSGVTPGFWSDSSYVFQPVVTDPNASVIDYAWKLNNVLISEATNSYLAFASLSNLTVGNTYTVQMTASDVNGSTNSSVSLTVIAPPPAVQVIFDDSFSRSGTLAGTEPDVAELFPASWLADYTFTCDGSAAVSTSISAAAAALPFIPQAGHVYVLSCDLDPSGETNWAAMGFAGGDSAAYDASIYGPSVVALGSHAFDNSAQMYWSPGYSENARPYDISGSSTYQIVLDTTTEPWQASFAEDGVVQFAPSALGSDPGIGSAFMANYQTGYAVFDNFKLTDSLAPSGPAHIEAEPPAQVFALQTFPASMGVAAIGAPALNYQWKLNNANLSDNGRIIGSHSNILIIVAAVPGDAGSYTVYVNNTAGADTSTACVLTVGDPQLTFSADNIPGWSGNINDRGSWSVNGTTSPVTGNGLELTDGSPDECSSAFFDVRQYIGAFQAAFTYQCMSPGAIGMGMSFILQNDPRGTNAIGEDGGINLGVQGAVYPPITYPPISPSVAFCMQNYPPDGYVWAVDAVYATAVVPAGSVNWATGDFINVSMAYESGWLAVAMQDTNATPSTSFSTNIYVGDITSVLGTNTAYVGFAGADETAVSVQTITDFTFTSIPLSIGPMSANTAVIAWPQTFAGYLLQQNDDLSTTNWVIVPTSQAILTNGLFQLAVPVTGSGKFYRLASQE